MGAYRWLDKLQDHFRLKVDLFMEEVRRTFGDIIFITETRRSEERQKQLIKEWKSFTPRSKHQDWLAIDIAFHWDELYPSDQWKWNMVARVAKKFEIDWWFDLWNWDKPHFQDGVKKIPIQYWLITNQDYLLTPIQQEENYIEYKQTPKDCAKYAPLWAMSDLLQKTFSSKEIKELKERYENNWVEVGKGFNYLQASWLFLQRYNAKFDDKKVGYIVNKKTKKFNDLVFAHYRMVMSRITSDSIVFDWKDGVLEKRWFPVSSKRHATTLKYAYQKFWEVNTYPTSTWSHFIEYRNWKNIDNIIKDYLVVFM